MSKALTPSQGKAILRNFDWTHFLIFLFDPTKKASDAEADLKQWINQEVVDWGEDNDDDEDGREQLSSYIVMGIRDNRIQGSAFYVLVAGATQNVDTSVEDWNKKHGTCTRIHLQAFGDKAHLRRKALVIFLRGLFDLKCLVWHRVDERISKEGNLSGGRELSRHHTHARRES